jgi:hypothetical protein
MIGVGIVEFPATVYSTTLEIIQKTLRVDQGIPCKSTGSSPSPILMLYQSNINHTNNKKWTAAATQIEPSSPHPLSLSLSLSIYIYIHEYLLLQDMVRYFLAFTCTFNTGFGLDRVPL